MLYMIPGNRRERSATALLPFYATCVYPVLRVWGYNSLMSCSELRGITYDRYAAASAGDQQAPAQTASQGAGGSYTAHVFKVPEGYEVTGEEIALSADNRTAVFAIRKAGAAKESGAMTESVQS